MCFFTLGLQSLVLPMIAVCWAFAAAGYHRPCPFSMEYNLGHKSSLSCFWCPLQVPFWNGCNEDEHCVPDLVLDARSDVPSAT